MSEGIDVDDEYWDDTADSDNVETLRITKKFLGRSRISKILDDFTKEFLRTSRISKKILDGHQKHKVSEASKTEGFLSFAILRQNPLYGKFSRIFRNYTMNCRTAQSTNLSIMELGFW